MQLTTKLGLRKPELIETADIGDLNYNADLIDANLGETMDSLGVKTFNKPANVQCNVDTFMGMNSDGSVSKLRPTFRQTRYQETPFTYDLFADVGLSSGLALQVHKVRNSTQLTFSVLKVDTNGETYTSASLTIVPDYPMLYDITKIRLVKLDATRAILVALEPTGGSIDLTKSPHHVVSFATTIIQTNVFGTTVSVGAFSKFTQGYPNWYRNILDVQVTPIGTTDIVWTFLDNGTLSQGVLPTAYMATAPINVDNSIGQVTAAEAIEALCLDVQMATCPNGTDAIIAYRVGSVVKTFTVYMSAGSPVKSTVFTASNPANMVTGYGIAVVPALPGTSVYFGIAYGEINTGNGVGTTNLKQFTIDLPPADHVLKTYSLNPVKVRDTYSNSIACVLMNDVLNMVFVGDVNHVYVQFLNKQTFAPIYADSVNPYPTAYVCEASTVVDLYVPSLRVFPLAWGTTDRLGITLNTGRVFLEKVVDIENFVGLVETLSLSTDATVKVRCGYKVITFTGTPFTAGKRYYLAQDGTITDTRTSIPVGVAIANNRLRLVI